MSLDWQDAIESGKDPDFIGAVPCVEVERVIEEKIDFNADSLKELYYGICSFMMKNNILSGKIYSSSREILDGLGDYMSSVDIPWGYDFDELKAVGYAFVDGAPPEGEKDKGVEICFNGKESISIKQGTEIKYNILVHNMNAVYEELDETDEVSPIHLKNEEIRKMFLKSFKKAKEEIDIICPWMNFGVVNDCFLDLMREALKRKVVIKIIYGLNPSESEYDISRSNRSDEVARKMEREFSEYKDQLFIKRDNIHYKLVLCDELFKLEGGYNYLSFIGDYEKSDTRKEGSPYGTDVEEIRYLRKEYFSCVK